MTQQTDRERLDANDYVSLLKAAKAHVNASVLYKRFIDGTPLENDIAVWMADFASDRLTALEHERDVPCDEIEGAAALCESEANRMAWSQKTSEHWHRVATILRGFALACRVSNDGAYGGQVTQQSDHEQLDACENDANPCPEAWPTQVDLWCHRCLIDRLAALEHERDEALTACTNAIGEAVKREREHAEAALLSLQTAVRALHGEMSLEANSYPYWHEKRAMLCWCAAKIAALLPGTAGTTQPKNDDDDQARVDGEEAGSDRQDLPRPADGREVTLMANDNETWERIKREVAESESAAMKQGMYHRGYRFWPPYACSRCGEPISAKQFAFARTCGGCDTSRSQTARLSIFDKRWFLAGRADLENPNDDGLIHPEFIPAYTRRDFAPRILMSRKPLMPSPYPKRRS